MSGTSIRPATRNDSARATELARLAKGSWGYPDEWLAIWRDELTITPEYLMKHQVFAAIEGEAIIGVCALEDHGQHWMLEHLWIDPQRKGGGVGRALVQHVLAVARLIRPGSVQLVADSFAEPFYMRLGAHKLRDVPAPMPGAPTRMLPLLEFMV